MKKHLLMTIMLAFSLAFTCLACNSEPAHTCTYDQQVVSAEFLKTEATCNNEAEYFFSCKHGKKSKTFFKYGEKLSHDIEYHQAKAPTCTEIGWEAYETCKRDGCNYTTYKELSALKHNLIDEMCTRCEYGIDKGLVFTLVGEEYRVTDYTGSASLVKIPVIYKSKPVTSIGSSAFYYCDSLTSITIPESVTSIGMWAFHYCDRLTIYCEVASEPYGWHSDWNSSNRPVVWDCNNNEVADNGYIYTVIDGIRYGIKDGIATVVRQPISITTANIPSTITYKGTTYNVTSIGDNAFEDCDSLTSVTIPSSVTSIEYEAFSCCDSLTSVTIPSSVTSIGEYVFAYCNSLTSITIPSSVTSVGNSAFDYCDSLTSITFGENSQLTSIGWGAFRGCSRLTIITIPSSVTSIGNDAFRNCNSLTSITIPSSVTSIGISAFYDCDSLTSITIPSSVTSIGISAFSNCDSLTSVTIPSSVTSIGYSAFEDCDSLTSVTIPSSVTSIGIGAFYSCDSLSSITIPDSVTSIGEDAFYSCDSLTIYCEAENQPSGWDSNWNSSNRPVVLGYKYALIDGIMYGIKDGVATVVRQPKNITTANILSTVTYKGRTYNVTSIGIGAFYSFDSLTSVTIPSSVTSIGSSAFRDCESLTSITIPSSVTSIGSSAFYGCDSLTSVTIPSSVTSIGSSAFYGCDSLTSVSFGENSQLTSIGNYAFEDCDSITSITIPDSVTSIGWGAFYYCDSLTIYCEVASKPSGWDSNWNRSNRPVVWDCKNK